MPCTVPCDRSPFPVPASLPGNPTIAGRLRRPAHRAKRSGPVDRDLPTWWRQGQARARFDLAVGGAGR